jgi:hypothetical protein
MNRIRSEAAAVPDSSRRAAGRTRQATNILTLFPTLALPLHSRQSSTADDDKPHFELMPHLVLGAMGGDIMRRTGVTISSLVGACWLAPILLAQPPLRSWT